MSTRFLEESGEPAVQGYLDEPERANGDGVVLAHGAGSNCQAKLLVEVSAKLAERGFTVLRIDLPFRQARAWGPPRPGDAGRDREGLKRAAELLKARVRGRVFMGGHSYGGRQASMLAAEVAAVAEGLLLLSYPLHPPRKPTELRTKHFSTVGKPAFFAHGTRDGFGSIAEMRAALQLLKVRHELLAIEGAGHDLLVKKSAIEVAGKIAEAFAAFVSNP
ncbi:MAG TPA: alpha/beta fold hydrolase [Methylomirabilota bacterium]|nr:alpha/beta fold hydrolase [Methylomirabilota bacterium]